MAETVSETRHGIWQAYAMKPPTRTTGSGLVHDLINQANARLTVFDGSQLYNS
jgi:hypothetical protein